MLRRYATSVCYVEYSEPHLAGDVGVGEVDQHHRPPAHLAHVLCAALYAFGACRHGACGRAAGAGGAGQHEIGPLEVVMGDGHRAAASHAVAAGTAALLRVSACSLRCTAVAVWGRRGGSCAITGALTTALSSQCEVSTGVEDHTPGSVTETVALWHCAEAFAAPRMMWSFQA